MPHRSLISSLSVLCLLVGASCFNEGKAPSIVPTRSLAPSPAGSAAHPAGPVSVLFHEPIGVVFDRPMLPGPPLGARVVASGGGAVAGVWRWVGQSAAFFSPRVRLPFATEFEVTVAAGAPAEDGSALRAPYTFRFATDRPRLVALEPKEGVIPANASFEAVFSQPVALEEVLRTAQLAVGPDAGHAVPLRARWTSANSKTTVTLTLNEPLTAGAPVALSFDASLHGLEGPLPMGNAEHFDMRTIGPLALVSSERSSKRSPGRCAASSVTIELSNPVAVRELKAHTRFEPAARIDWNRADDDVLTKVDLVAALSPSRKYELVMSAGMKDVYGQALVRPITRTLDIGRAPWLHIDDAEVFEADPSRGAPSVTVESANVPAFDLLVQPLTEVALARYLSDSGPAQIFDPLADAHQHFPQSRVEVIRPRVPFGVETRRVSLDAVLGTDRGRGAALVVAETEGPTAAGAQLSAARVVTRTDLGITARMGLRGGVVWVTHLSDGKPAAGATVSVREGKTGEIVSARADELGMAVLPEEAYSPIGELGALDPHAMIVARSGDDWTFRPISDALELDCKEPELGRESLTGLVLTEKADYELGETISVKALFKDERGSAGGSLAGRSVHLSVTGAQGNLVSAADGKLDSYGGFTGSVRIPAVERPGPWVLRADVLSPGERASGSASARIRVAAATGTEAGIAITADRAAYVRGDLARFELEAKDALGAPIGGESVTFSIRAKAERFAPPGTGGLVTDDSAYAESAAKVSRELRRGSATLSADGRARIEVPLDAVAFNRPTRITIEAKASANAGPILGQTSVLVHPGDLYVALVPPRDRFITKGSPVHASAFALDLAGGKKAGVPIRFELLEKGRAAASCAGVTAGAPAACDLIVPRSGAFVLRASAEGSAERAAAASLALEAPGADAPFAERGRTRVSMVSDRAVYEVGQTALVLVESPFKDADALVSIEGASALRGERIHAVGPTPTFRVPITRDMLPSAHLSVLLLQRGSASSEGKDESAPIGLGDLDLRVDPTSRRLHVAIAPAPRPVADDFLEADVAVTDVAGAPVRASVTFYAVEDSGARVPGLYKAFEAPPAPSSYWIESRADLGRPIALENPALESLLPGEGADLAGDERAGKTAFFDGSLLTDVVGRVHVRFRVPEGLASLRLVAAAMGEGGRFGATEEVVDVSPMLGVVVKAPSVVRAGDAFTATASITVRGAARRSGIATATLGTIGLDAAGAVTQEIKLEPGVRVVTSWPLVAPEAGKAEIVVRVRAGDMASLGRTQRVVIAAARPEAVVLYGESAKASAEGLGRFGKWRKDEGGLDLKVAPSLLVGLDEGVEQILEFPYVDTQQHVTRVAALLGLADLLRDYAVPVKDTGPWADREIAAILEAQLGDGSFAPWGSAPGAGGALERDLGAAGEGAWRSIYALWALNLAGFHDHAVPSDAMARALAFVRSGLATWDRTPRERAEAAFALDVLAEMGFPDIEKMEALFQARGQLPLFARSLLAHAMTVTQMDNGMVDDLLGDAESHLRTGPDGATVADEASVEYMALLDSSTRSTAMLLRALVGRAKARAPNVFKKIRPPELASRLARGLLAARRGGTWRTPEETVWALRALEDYRAAHVPNHPDVDAFFYLNDEELLKMSLHEKGDWQKTASFGMRKVMGAHGDGATLGFRVKGDETVHYEARLRYAETDLPAVGVDRGFAVERRVTRLPASGPTASVSQGDRVLVDVLVVSPIARDHVVVDDPVPGGLVVAPVATTGSVEGYRVEVRADRVVATFGHLPAGISHVRYVALAKTPGRYVVPPTRVTSIYEPELVGTTAASSFEVK